MRPVPACVRLIWWLFCFSVAIRLGGDVVPLIQIKQSASGVRTVPPTSLAAKVVSGRAS